MKVHGNQLVPNHGAMSSMVVKFEIFANFFDLFSCILYDWKRFIVRVV